MVVWLDGWVALTKKTLDRKIEALEALRAAPLSAASQEQLRKALQDRSNYAVARAAAVVADLQLQALVQDLVAAFDGFLANGAKADPQCWGKNAIAKALKDVGHRGAEVFLRGSRHFQWEAVWGGREDTAATLRGTCALALVGSDLGDLEILRRLAELLADPAKTVRVDAARAIAQLGRVEGAILLRFKALSGDREPEVVGQCLSALLAIEPRVSIPFVAQFLDAAGEDVRIEAAGALSESAEPEAMQALEWFWNRQTDPGVRRTLLALLGASPVPESARLLVRVLGEASGETAIEAVQALARSRFRAQVREEAAAAVARGGDARARRAFESAFGAG